MGYINANVKVDLSRKLYNVVNVVQNDTGRSIIFQILDNGTVYDITGFTIRAYTTTECYKDLKIINATAGVCMLDINNSMIDVQGEINLQLRLLKNSIMVTSFAIKIKSEKSLVDDSSIQSSNKLSALDTALNQVQTWNNYFSKTSGDLETKYTTRLTEVESREYGAENLLKDSGFLSGNIGTDFPWRTYGATATIEDSSSSTSGKMVKVVNGSTAYRGIVQHVYDNRHKDYYTVSCRVKGTKGNRIRFGLNPSMNEFYTFKNTDVWENVILTISDLSHVWDSEFTIYSVEASSTFYIEDVALWEGKNAFTYKYNSKDLIYDRLRISRQDLRLISKSGKYCGVGCLNSPFNDSDWGFYDIEVHSSAYKKIIAHNYNANDIFVCSCINGTWTGWEQIANQSFCKNPVNITQDSTHRFVTDAEKGYWNRADKADNKTFTAVTNSSFTIDSTGYNFIQADIFIENKQNTDNFTVKINGAVLSKQDGGGQIHCKVTMGRIGSKWIRELSGTFSAISGSATPNMSHVSVSTDSEITSIELDTESSSLLENGIFIVKMW